ncbi:MAG: hypothetical protein M3P49_05180 [Actinomycetota bacterium]|nr:hypothetical protein [Actinomycetota bacterium]
MGAATLKGLKVRTHALYAVLWLAAAWVLLVFAGAFGAWQLSFLDACCADLRPTAP